MYPRLITSISGAKAGNATHTITNSDPSRPMKLILGHVILVNDATVANRRPILTIKDAAGNELIDIHAGAVATASQTVHFSFMQGVYREGTVVGNSLQVPIPMECIIPAGGSAVFSIEAGVAGDSYTANALLTGL